MGMPLGVEPSQSPRFYGDVVRSRELLERVLLTRYPNPRGADRVADSTTLLRILRVRGMPGQWREMAQAALPLHSS